ncbi:hypothetical protein [Alterinioella nitratireducens]|uniref:hypothetical protein n=1 Tax=Alterinioella nitratireducens TaxID=2735915 RepID=UPI00405A11C3
MTFRHALAAAVLTALALPAAAQDYENCQWQSNEGRIAQSYELVGPAACEALCTETEGCSSWYYIPHNFNPTGGPGECGLYGAASDPQPHDREYCGTVGSE